MSESTLAHLKSRVRYCVSILVAAVVAILIWHLVSERHAAIAAARQQSQGYARALSEHAGSSFAEADHALRDLVDAITAEGGIDRLDNRTLLGILKRQRIDCPQVSLMFVVNRSGKMVVNSQFPTKQIDVSDREYYLHYRQGNTGLFISRPLISRLVNRWRFTMTRPLLGSDGSFCGLVAVGLDVDYFQKFYASIKLGRHGKVVLLRSDGAPLVYEPYAANAYRTDFTRSVLFRTYLPSAPAGTYEVDRGIVDGEPHLSSYASLSQFPVVAVVSMQRDDVLTPWKRKAIIESAMMLGLCLGLFLLTRLLLRHLTRLQSVQVSLHEQEEQVRVKEAQIDAANDAILMVDGEGRLIHFNNALCRMTGYDHGTLTGVRLHDIEPPDHAARIEANIRALREEGVATFESAYLTADGAVLPVEVHARIMESDGKQFVLSIVKDINERKRSERREETRLRILEAIATGVGLPELLEQIVRFVEQEREGALCSVLLVDDLGTCLRHGAAPSLPDFYNQAVDGLKIGPKIGSCGAAAFTRKRVVVEEIEGHPNWKGFEPAREAGLRACWSEPVISSSGELLGTFATYSREPRSPEQSEIQLIESAAHLASIAIERSRSEDLKNRLQEQLHHVQKIEAIGQLAGGIAHDFNNLLTPIIVYADMIQMKLPEGDPMAVKTRGIMSAANKARDLTQQLLSFGRKQQLSIQPVELNEVILSFREILRRTIRENIDIDVRLAPGGVIVSADRGQVEQILLNLAVNGQDAITGNGSIVIETGHVVLDDEYVRLHPGLQPGPHALLAFSDDGCGMDDETLSHIFEPFFTTKQVGYGTGLGLATVYGIIKQHEGYISVISRVGKGTTFSIYLPLSGKPAIAATKPTLQEASAGTCTTDATILIVEDNDMVRTMAVELLETAGYRVLVADRPSVARNIAQEKSAEIDLLLTDVMMPEMNGPDLYEHLHVDLPELKVLYISGYTNEVSVHNGTLQETVNFLQKPFTIERLLERVRQALG